MEDNVLQPDNSMTLEEIRKEEEFINTIKMEPILEKISIEEEETVVKERKMMKLTDYFLIGIIFVLIAVFIFIVLNVK